MQTGLTLAFYAASAGVLIILALGLVNLVRNDERRASRSNQLMRLRVILQFVAILILVALGIAGGAIKLGGVG